MSSPKVCLIVTFNSPFVSNIPVLLDLYKSRFDQIFFLIHEPEKYENALKVEGKSHYFHNYFLQNFEQIRGYDYYIFTHDDAILHPQLNKHNLWSHFSIPYNAICLRNIDLVPRESSWSWAWQGGYDVVDTNPRLRNFLIEQHPQLCANYLKFIAPFQFDKYADLENIVKKHRAPLLFGGGANADLMFMSGKAMENLMEKIELLNFPGFFVEIVVPMAILLTDWPVYLLRYGRHAPIHFPRGRGILWKLLVLVFGSRISYHPIKIGTSHPLIRKIFVFLYHLASQLVT